MNNTLLPYRTMVIAIVLAISGSEAVLGDGTGYTISTIAGSGERGFGGDGGPATKGLLNRPCAVAVDAESNLYIADYGNNRIRKVRRDGTITTLAGTGEAGYAGDGGLAVKAQLQGPYGVSVDQHGNVYVADQRNHRIRRITPDGTIASVAGTGRRGFSGDGGPATAASLAGADATVADSDGNLYIADTQNHRIRKVSADGTITTIAGSSQGYSGDGGPAVRAQLNFPAALALDSAGNLYVGDFRNHVVRKITRDGIIHTVAGSGKRGFNGDNIPATKADLNEPGGVAALPDGSLIIADGVNCRVRCLGPDGVIRTIAGTGRKGYSGDGGPARDADLSILDILAVDRDGNIFVADHTNNRIRKLTPTRAGAAAGIGRSTATLADRIKKLDEEYQHLNDDLELRSQQIGNADEKKRIEAQGLEQRRRFAARFMDLVRNDRQDPAAIGALAWILQNDPAAPEAGDAVETLLHDFGQDPATAKLAASLVFFPPNPLAEKLLRGLARQANQTNAESMRVRLAAYLVEKADDIRSLKAEKASGKETHGRDPTAAAYLREADAADVCREAQQILASALEATPKMSERKTEYARRILFEAEHLSVGQTAPEIEGSDLDGQRMRLSDFRGKVVVLKFWATWCGPCMGMVPHDSALMSRLKGKPFTLLGIDSDEDRAQATKIIASKEIRWRSWWDGGSRDGPIAKAWNVSGVWGWPTIYVLDGNGVIRYKRVRGQALDDAVDYLLEEMTQKDGVERKP